MGVIIGSMTTVSFAGAHVSQVSWNVSPNIQRAYILGQWTPYTDAETASPTETMNLTSYATNSSYSTLPTTSCINANQVSASVSPAGCGAGSSGPSSTTWYVTSYSYSKGDARTPGTESWSMMQYVTMGIPDVVLPTYVLRGISEGSITSSDDVATASNITGVQMDAGSVSTGTTGSVSAGQIGRSDNQYNGTISAVGGSQGGSGDIAQGSCSMPYTPLYI